MRKSQPQYLICNFTICQVLFILYFNYLIYKIRFMYRTLIWNPLNMVLFTSWFPWKQALRVNLTNRVYVTRLGKGRSWTAIDTQATSGQKLRGALDHVYPFRVGQKWLDICTCLSQSLDGGARTCLRGSSTHKLWQTLNVCRQLGNQSLLAGGSGWHISILFSHWTI